MKLFLALLLLAEGVLSFSVHTNGPFNTRSVVLHAASRRSFLDTSMVLAGLVMMTPGASNAAIGTLPELQDTNIILQGLTVTVADQSQLNNMITFLLDAFDFKVLRQTTEGTVTNTWCGYGPEQLSIPSDFQLPVSSFGMYGGHAAINVSYDTQTSVVNYRTGGDAPGDNIAYLQVGVPAYRVSQMVKNGGNVLDAYGIVNVISPCGLPMRSIVGISPDPIMFVALNCQNVEASKAFYTELGFVEQEYPYCRPNKGTGQFEPPQPPKSVYLAPSANSMGILLLQANKKKKITPNPVLQSLNLVYAGDFATPPAFLDPSGVKLSFQSVKAFTEEEEIGRVASAK